MTLSLAFFIQSDATLNVAIKKFIFERGHQLEALYLDNNMSVATPSLKKIYSIISVKFQVIPNIVLTAKSQSLILDVKHHMVLSCFINFAHQFCLSVDYAFIWCNKLNYYILKIF